MGVRASDWDPMGIRSGSRQLQVRSSLLFGYGHSMRPLLKGCKRNFLESHLADLIFTLAESGNSLRTLSMRESSSAVINLYVILLIVLIGMD